LWKTERGVREKEMAHEERWHFRGELSAYLSPTWSFGEGAEAGAGVVEAEGSSIIETVTAELEAYALAFARSTRADLSAEDEQAISSVIAAHSQLNVDYCKRLLAWIVAESAGSSAEPTQRLLSRLIDNYMQYAPGPWREATLLACLPAALAAARLGSTGTGTGKDQARAAGAGTGTGQGPGTGTEADDDRDDNSDTHSLSGSTVTLATDLSGGPSLLTGGGSGSGSASASKAKMQRLAQMCSKYKGEVAVLKERCD